SVPRAASPTPSTPGSWPQVTCRSCWVPTRFGSRLQHLPRPPWQRRPECEGAMSDCLFCKIVAGEVPAKIVKRSGDALAFRDTDAKAPVHVLVIPTRHIAAVRDTKGADGERLLGRLLAFAAEVAGELDLDGDGYRIVTNT